MNKLTNKNHVSISKTLRSYSMVFVLIAIVILFQLLTGGYKGMDEHGIKGFAEGLTLKPRNMTNIILQQSYIVILILGMLPVILTGNVDLSVGSTVAFVGAVAAVLQVNQGWGTLPTLVVALAIGAAIGAWNGLWIAIFDIPAFIVTLSSQLVFRGLSQVVLKGASIGPFDDTFRAIAGSFITDFTGEKIASYMPYITMGLAGIACLVFALVQIIGRRNKIAHGVPVKSVWGMIARIVIICGVIAGLSYMLSKDKGYPTVLVILLVFSMIYSFVCNRTVFGRSLYAVGGNRKAAALSGIKDRLSMFMAYTNMGFVAAIAALVYAARMNVATPKAGTGFELDAIAACYVGGASVSGGAGTIGGALIGCFVIGILNNGMSLLGISPDWQQTVKGIVILGSVAFDIIPKMRKK